jgi:hypothetical protein
MIVWAFFGVDRDAAVVVPAGVPPVRIVRPTLPSGD